MKNWLIKSYFYPFLYSWAFNKITRRIVINPYVIFENNYNGSITGKYLFYGFKTLVYVPCEIAIFLSIFTGFLFVLFWVLVIMIGLFLLFGILSLISKD